MRVAHGRRSGGIGADVVALHPRVRPTGVVDQDTHVGVAGNDVALGCVVVAVGIGADEGADGPRKNRDAENLVTQRGRSVGVGADVVALHGAACGGVADHHARATVGRNHVARTGCAAAHHVACDHSPQPHTAVEVAQRPIAVRRGADVVALD